MGKGDLIGRGMTAEAFEWENDKMLKLFYNWAPKDWVTYEMHIGKALNEVGIPSPKVYDLIEVEGRYGIIYQRIFGDSMLKHIESNPLKLRVYSHQIAKFHYKIHSQSAQHLCSQKERLCKMITASSESLADKTDIILNYLEQLDNTKKLCHGDFHPDNILIEGKDLYIIDWMNAYEGNPLSDVARTCLMLQSPFIMPGTSAFITFLLKKIKYLFHKWYINEYIRLSATTLEEIEEWMLPVAAARLKENIPNEKEWLMRIIDKKLERII